jgi:intracellular sulfur oxidation DsrE/DsrF family protein
MKHDISDEQLNAFIDDELDTADREHVLAAVAVDGELAQRACALRLVKEQVRHAYAEPPDAPSRRQPARPWRALAMALLLAGAAVSGWIARDQAGMGGDTYARKPDTGHVILHLASSDEQRARVALDDAEGLLRTAQDAGQPIAVELVANAGGLDLLRAGVSPHADRIARLRTEHPNLALIACGQTVERLRERSIEVRLLPGTRVASSALDQIVTRMGQGWSYVRI